jgi:hypothetical protein
MVSGVIWFPVSQSLLHWSRVRHKFHVKVSNKITNSDEKAQFVDVILCYFNLPATRSTRALTRQVFRFSRLHFDLLSAGVLITFNFQKKSLKMCNLSHIRYQFPRFPVRKTGVWCPISSPLCADSYHSVSRFKHYSVLFGITYRSYCLGFVSFYKYM